MSKFGPKIHHRRSIRLKGYDYSQAGEYFVTIVTWQRECMFGDVVNGNVALNEFGRIVEKWWNQIPAHFPSVDTLTFVIMPNHIHGIIIINDDGRGAVSAPENETQNQGEMTSPLRVRKPTLGQVVAYFKYQSTKDMNAMDNTGTITKFWQRNYYACPERRRRKHIIRDEREMDRIHRYIEANPSQWADDDENPVNL